MARLFKGGIHPFARKEITRKKPLMMPEFPPLQVILPLLTTYGGSLTPLVEEGHSVAMGQLLAQAEDEKGVPLFSSVSGVVKEIAPHPHPLFGLTPSIVIENDFKNRHFPHKAPENPQELSQEQLISLVKDLGLRGMTRDEAPVHLKIMEGRGRIDHLIVNAAECEPYLSADHRLLLEHPEMILQGSQFLATMMGAGQIVVVIQGDKIDGGEILEQQALWDKKTMRLRTIPTGYPYGEEKQVIRFVTGKEIPSGKANHHAHCGVFNVATVFSVGEAILKGTPQTHRAVTVSGGAVQRPRNFWMPIGSPLESIFVNADGLKEDAALILLGGPMTGVSQRDLRVPLLGGSSGVLALADWEIPPRLQEKTTATMPCIRCGHCLTVCPMHLTPNMVYAELSRNNPSEEKLLKLSPQSCIRCGCCNYRCPAHLPLAQTMAEAQMRFENLLQAEEDVTLYHPDTVKVKKSKGKRKKKVKKSAAPKTKDGALSKEDRAQMAETIGKAQVLDSQEKFKTGALPLQEKFRTGNIPHSDQFRTGALPLVEDLKPKAKKRRQKSKKNPTPPEILEDEVLIVVEERGDDT